MEYAAGFNDSGKRYEGYMRLEWQMPKRGKSGWFGLIRIGSPAEANATHWDEHFP